MELRTHGGEQHEIGDGGRLMMPMVMDSPLRSPERTPDQPSREIRAWRRLRIVKRDESFSLIFSPQTRIYRVGFEVGGAPGGPRGRGRAQGGRRASHPRGQGVGPLALILSPVFFINSKNILRGVSGHSENFYFYTKITPWQFC